MKIKRYVHENVAGKTTSIIASIGGLHLAFYIERGVYGFRHTRSYAVRTWWAC